MLPVPTDMRGLCSAAPAAACREGGAQEEDKGRVALDLTSPHRMGSVLRPRLMAGPGRPALRPPHPYDPYGAFITLYPRWA